MKDTLFIEAVAERDIDLLILEELHVSTAFRAWLYDAITGQAIGEQEFYGAYHSISHTTLGESDLVVKFQDREGQTTALLIENKIDALPQPEQASRYQQRGEAGIAENRWQRYRTGMIAPKAYIDRTVDAQGYEAQISYETLRDWFHHEGSEDPRHQYKARFMQAAIDQERRGYQPIPHAEVTQFWADYWQLVQAEYRQLKMIKPGKVPARSDWPEFRNPELVSEGRTILHKLGTGVVDIQINGAGPETEKLRSSHAGLLVDGIDITQTGKSASIRMQVPPLDRFLDLAQQVDAVRQGLNAATRLLAVSQQIRWRRPLPVT